MVGRLFAGVADFFGPILKGGALHATGKGLRTIWDASPGLRKVTKASLGVAGYYTAGKVGEGILGKVAERERAIYGRSGAADALETFGGTLGTLALIEGAESLIGTSHLQRLRYLGKDIANIGRYGKKLARYSKLSKAERSATKKSIALARDPKFKLLKGKPTDFIDAMDRSSWISPSMRKTLINPSPTRPSASFRRLGTSLSQGSLLYGLYAANNKQTMPYGAIATGIVGAGMAIGGGAALGISRLAFGESAFYGGAAFAAGAVGGSTFLRHPFTEGNIIDVSPGSAIDRMNFSTAGLVQAIRNQSRRVY